MKKSSAWSSMAIFSVLTGCSTRNPSPPPVDTAAAAQAAGRPSAADTGERIYSGSCIACHQQNAQGIPGVYPSLAGSPVVLGDPKELALWVIKGQRPVAMPMGRYPTMMLQFGWMKPEDAAALFTYLRSNFGNSATPVDAVAVAQALGQ
jgi:mono/diheme cytochrome c family protein